MRAQSHVVGVALMLTLAVVALGALTAGVGTVLQSQAASADADRVATVMDDALEGVEQTGYHSYRLTFSEGSLSTEPRTLRVLDANGTVLQNHSVDALVFEGNGERVASVGGAVVRGEGSGAWLVSEPPITGSETNDVLVVGIPVLDAGHVTVSGRGGTTTTLETNVTHTATELGRGEFAVAIETATPEPLERHFEEQNATVHRQSFDGDSAESVVARYPGERSGHVVVHNLSLEVR